MSDYLEPDKPEYQLHVHYVPGNDSFVGVNARNDDDAKERGLACWRKTRGDKLRAELQKKTEVGGVWETIHKFNFSDLKGGRV